MAEGDTWVSSVLTDSSLVVGTDIDRSEPAWQAIERGEPPAAEDLPIRIYAKYKNQIFNEKLPQLFFGSGGIKISKNLAEVIQKFNLGRTDIRRAQLFLHDRKTPIDQPLCSLGSLEKMKLLAPNECKNLRGHVVTRHLPNPPPPAEWGMPWELQDGDIAIVSNKANSLDTWTDANLKGSWFFSDCMKQALCDAGYAKLFQFRKCRTLRLN
ncbi:MAG: hypothetical protein HWE35_08370 [Rhodobacteraceae bacterium]|nr:hypothetical protein [Paracoccaceae bacterium]